jgi:hypothetical protein
VKRAAPTLSERIDRAGGVGYRAFAGYDKTIGLVGVEAGIGNGGKDARHAVTRGTYRLDPGWAWDASARFGLLPAANLLLYGRAGYGWTRANEQVAFGAAGRTPFRRKTTEGGFMYGFGAEIAVAKSFAIRTEFDQTGKSFKAARLQLGGVVHFCASPGLAEWLGRGPAPFFRRIAIRTMRGAALLPIMVLALAGCATEIMRGYIGALPEAVMARYGPPDRVYDLPDGRRAYQWMDGTRSTSLGSGETRTRLVRRGRQPPERVTTTRTNPAIVGERRCYYTMYAHRQGGGWVFEDFERPKRGC